MLNSSKTPEIIDIYNMNYIEIPFKNEFIK